MAIRYRRTALLPGLLLAAAMNPVLADDEKLQASISQLRHIAGEWATTTEDMNPDGSVAQTLEGTYRFEWVVPDRVLSGRSIIPELDRVSALLFYVNESKAVIEMVSVGADGRLWIMTGDLGDETRYTEPYPTQDGGSGRLRFTRYNVGADRFESMMEYTVDGGETWAQGNHQVFRRVR